MSYRSFASDSQQVLALAGRTLEPGEASMEPSTIEELVNTSRNDRAQRARARLKAVLVCVEVVIKVLLENTVESGLLRISRTVDSRLFANIQRERERSAIKALWLRPSNRQRGSHSGSTGWQG